MCVQIDQFEWVEESDGIYGKIMSRFSGKYISLSNKWWQNDIYMADEVEYDSWRLQKWRIVDGMLVKDMKTVGKNNLPVVLSHDPATGKLTLTELGCGNSALKWDLSLVENDLAGQAIPEGKDTHFVVKFG